MVSFEVIVAPNSFKESLAASAAAGAMQRGVLAACPEARVLQRPLADGGDGTVEVLVQATGGRLLEATVDDPLGRPITASYGILGDGTTAVIEMAKASGLALLSAAERDPLRTTTLGTGQLMLAALAQGARKLIVGLGGSATNDAGMGVAHALGARFVDGQGRELPPVGASLGEVRELIRWGALGELLAGVEIMVACDVTNPLCGDQGAAAIYGPQKGASAAAVAELDQGLRRWCAVVEAEVGREIGAQPGGGAAGGLAAALVALGAELRPGVDLVMDAYGLDAELEGAALALTGEGKLDEQTAFGKAPARFAARARDRGVPVLALAGVVDESAHRALAEHGILACWSIAPGPIGVGESLRQVEPLLVRATESAVRTFLAGSPHGAG